MSAEATPRNPLAAAWRWSLRYSPIMLGVRGVTERVRRHRHAAALIAGSDLPAPVRERIGAIVRRTRLHAAEQGEVARELLAHAHDAAADAKTEPEILASLGDPRPVGRLIRRAVKRKRPLVYQLRRWTVRAMLACVALAFVFYLALTARFYTGSPSVKTNYFARLNAPIHALPESDKASPVYLEAMIEWAGVRERLRESTRVDPNAPGAEFIYPGVDLLHDVPRNHPDYDATVAALKAFRPTLDRVAEAAARPALGALYSDRTRQIEVYGAERWIEATIEPAAEPTDQMPLVFATLPHLGRTREVARLLAFDIQVAMDDADADRVAADVHALLGLARQLTREPMLVSSLVGVAVHELAMRRLALVIDESPDLLSRDQLVALSHHIAAGRDSTVTLNLDTERLIFEDLLQRAFTDDGRGDGRLTPAGARLLSGLSDPPPDFAIAPEEDDLWIARSANTLAMPVMGAAVKGRAEQLRLQAEMIDAAERALAAGPSASPKILEEAQQRLQTVDRDPVSWYPIAQVFPAISQSVVHVFVARASADATLALLAAAAYRHDHARWPDSLDELVPAYLPRVPDDPFRPGTPLSYRLEGGAPLLWYAGADGDDDRGSPPGPTRGPIPPRRVNDLRGPSTPGANVPDGDWILFPPQD